MTEPLGNIYAQSARFTAELLAENDAAALRMVRAYAPLFDELTAKWQAALMDIVAHEEDGSARELDFLRLRATRLDALRRQTATEIARFAKIAGVETQAEQRTAIELAGSHAATLTATGLSLSAPGIQHSFAQLPRGALTNLVGVLGDGSPLHTLLDTLGPNAADAAGGVLFRALATGMNPRIAARELRTQLGVPLGRALTISRSSMLDSYRSASLASYRANRDVISGWRFVAHIGPRACSACIALHNTVHFLDEFFPRHPNCRCSPIPITKTWEELGFPTSVSRRAPRPLVQQAPGPDLFAEMSDADQLRVLGPGKLALYRAGRIDLQDTAVLGFHPQWGAQLHEASIAEALAAHARGGSPAWLRYTLER